MRKKITSLLLGLALVGLLSTAAFAGNTDTATVAFEVAAINEIDISGDPAAMTVSSATAGGAPNEVTNAATTYAVTTNGTSKKIQAKINSAMPSGVTLKVNLTAVTGGTSAGDVTLTASDQDTVTGITKLNESTKTITYKLSATSAAGVVAPGTRTLTLTLTDGS